MELVTEPDITSGIEARKFAEELQLIFRYLGVSDAHMEKGLMRVEVNISLSKGNPSSRGSSGRSGSEEPSGSMRPSVYFGTKIATHLIAF